MYQLQHLWTMLTKKPTSPELTPPVELAPSPDFSTIESRIFAESNGVIYIGGKPVTKQMREILRDQAKSLSTSQLWEILSASVENEAINIALVQSANFEHVISGKMLHHYRHFINNTVHKLAQD